MPNTNQDDDKILAFLFVIGLLVGFLIGAFGARSYWRNVIIKHSAAEWVCHPITGEIEFVWKIDKKEKNDEDR